MVFFICNHCGESVKKSSVEKHYLKKCRSRIKNVSCMDCQKDFCNEDYVAHTRCISEAEKYSGKDYVAKPSQNKGLKKQETWIEIVRSILENPEYKLEAQTRNIFQRLQIYENVPRKKQKFQNFIANCLRMPPKQAASVWNVLEKELEKMKQAKQRQQQQKSQQQQLQQMESNKNQIPDEQKEKKVDKKNKSSINKQINDFNGIASNENEYSNNNGDFISLAHLEKQQTSAALSLDKDVTFKFNAALENLVNKYDDGINIIKLKEKFKKKYQKKCFMNDLNEEQNKKYEKKFNKAIKKLSNKLEIIDDVVKRKCNT